MAQECRSSRVWAPQVLGAVSAFLKQAAEGDNRSRAKCVQTKAALLKIPPFLPPNLLGITEMNGKKTYTKGVILFCTKNTLEI